MRTGFARGLTTRSAFFATSPSSAFYIAVLYHAIDDVVPAQLGRAVALADRMQSVRAPWGALLDEPASSIVSSLTDLSK